MLKGIFAISLFASLGLALAVSLAMPGQLFQTADSSWRMVYFGNAESWTLDSGMTLSDCVDSSLANGLECQRENVRDSFNLSRAPQSSRPTPAHVCALLLDAAQRGAPDGYARAESNCGAIY